MTRHAAQVDVVAAVVREASTGRFLLAQRAPGDAEAGRWEFPGGKRRPDEILAQSLVRELREELGVRATAGRRLGTIDRPPLRLHFIEARIKSGEPRAKEHAALRWVEKEHLLDHDLLDADRAFVERGLLAILLR